MKIFKSSHQHWLSDFGPLSEPRRVRVEPTLVSTRWLWIRHYNDTDKGMNLMRCPTIPKDYSEKKWCKQTKRKRDTCAYSMLSRKRMVTEHTQRAYALCQLVQHRRRDLSDLDSDQTLRSYPPIRCHIAEMRGKQQRTKWLSQSRDDLQRSHLHFCG